MDTVVAVPLDERLAEFIGKKGSDESSITFYNRKVGDSVIVAIAPSSIDEKFYAVPQTLLMADQILVSTGDIDKVFGEVLIACSLLGKRTIFTKDGDISQMLSALKFQGAEFCDREQAVETLMSFASAQGGSSARIDIDRAFNVKGVGVVALGVVTKGTVKVHDAMQHSSGKLVTIRSIQSQDEDVKEAHAGARVGLALKGISEEEMQKGDTLSKSQIKPAKKIKADLNNSPFIKEPLEVGKAYSIAIGFSYVVSFLEEISGNLATLRLEKAVPVETGDAFLMSRTIQPRIFASGKVLSVE